MENKCNSKSLWTIIKSITKTNKKSKFQEKLKLSEGSYTDHLKIIGEKCNKLFLNVGRSLSNRILIQSCSPDQFIKMKAVYS